MNDSRLRELFLEANTSCHQTPEERVKTAFECLVLAIKLRQAAKQSVINVNES